LPTLTLDGVPVGSAKLRPVMKDLVHRFLDSVPI
jgi:hypothetical protein